MSVGYLLARLVQFYTFLIFAYVLMSWFPISGFFEDIYRVLGSICEPWIGLFRRIVPSAGGLDFSAMVSILVLWVISQYVIPLIRF